MTRGSQLDKWLNFAQSRLFPPVCLLCGVRLARPALDLCPGCLHDLPHNDRACRSCGQPLPGGAADHCGRCLRRAPPFDRLIAPFRYAHPVDRLLQGFKFHGRLPAGRLLGELAAERFLAREGARPDLILPVPLHTARLRERGYNQALELARPVAAALQLPLETALCRRRRPTRAQSELTAAERRRNVRGAFELTGEVEAAFVVIFDDVVSTGSTVGELARLLRRQGAERVEVWAVARAGRE